MQYQVVVDPSAAGSITAEHVFYEPGATRSQAADDALYVYEHHGDSFGQSDPGALTCMFEEIALGRALPMTFVTPAVRDVDTAFAMALFLDRGLVLHPSMPGIVASVDLVHRRGPAMLSHVDPQFGQFLGLLRGLFGETQIPRRELGLRVGKAAEWVRAYAETGMCPHATSNAPAVIEVDSFPGGLVLARTEGDLSLGCVEMYRRGYVRVMLVSTDTVGGRRRVMLAKKSPFVSGNMAAAVRVLNEMERASGAPPTWEAGDTWASGPVEGSSLLASQVLQVFRQASF